MFFRGECNIGGRKIEYKDGFLCCVIQSEARSAKRRIYGECMIALYAILPKAESTLQHVSRINVHEYSSPMINTLIVHPGSPGLLIIFCFILRRSFVTRLRRVPLDDSVFYAECSSLSPFTYHLSRFTSHVLNIKSKMHHIPIFHYIFLSFNAETAIFTCGSF